MPNITTKNLVLGSTAAKPGLETWYGTHLEERTIEDLKPNEVVLKVNAVGFNHRDKWIRQGLYPGIKEGVTMGSDAAGVIIADGDDKDTFVGKRYFVNPSRGWIENKKHSEEPFIILGGCDNAEGVFATAVKVDKKYIFPTPEHLTDEVSTVVIFVIYISETSKASCRMATCSRYSLESDIRKSSS